MEKMPMCRICLVENVRMYIVVDKDLHELYETLTDIPFVTEDSRPILACFICCTKLKQCCQLQRKCLEAEELFSQMMNERNPLVNRGQREHSSGLTVTSVQNISISVCERLDDVTEPDEEHQSDELQNVTLRYSDVEETLGLHWSESDSEDDVPLMELETEVQEKQEVSRKKQRTSDTTRPAVAKKQKLHTRGRNLEDVVTEHQKKNEESGTTVSRNTSSCASKLIPEFQEPLTNTTPRVNISVIDTISDTNGRNDIKERNLSKHTCIRTGKAPYKCDICQYSCKKKGILIKHIRVHTGEKPHKCDAGQRCISEKGGLTKHIRTHTTEKPYKCEECRLCFSRKFYLTRHLRTHTGEKPYKCEVCQLCFSQKNSLTRHIRLHTREKSYKCNTCQSCFSEKGTLISHTGTNASEKPYKCEECQRCFTQKYSLTQHMRLHTGEKPYKCAECQRCFSQKKSLRQHIRKHIGEKPYKCEECQRM